MMGSLYDALKSANVPEDMAQKAAEEVASREADIADLKSDMKLLKMDAGRRSCSRGGAVRQCGPLTSAKALFGRGLEYLADRRQIGAIPQPAERR